MRQHVERNPPRPAPRRRLALRLAGRRDARCVGPTSAISRARTSTRISPVLGTSSACAPSRPRRSPDSTSVRLASAGCTFLSEIPRARRCPPDVKRANRASGTPVASPSQPTPLARCSLLESRREHCRFARVNVANRSVLRSAFHRARTSAPQRPFERPARASPILAAWPPQEGLSTPFHPRVVLADGSEARSPVTRSAANGCRASWNLGVARRFLQPVTTHGHTLRAVDLRARVGLSSRYSPASTDAGCVGRADALPHR